MLPQANIEIKWQTPNVCLPNRKKYPGYTDWRMPNEQNYKEEL